MGLKKHFAATRSEKEALKLKFEQRKDLLGLRDMSREEIELILDTAIPMKDIVKRDIKKGRLLEARPW
jgi:aspartate carbamoyltransferase catalytic subunit